MPKTRKVGPAGSLGARYGTVARRRYTSIMTELRTPKPCPMCRVIAVRREAVGIWSCRKCGYKFTGGAYVPQTKLGEISRRGKRAPEQTVAGKAASPEQAPQAVAVEKPKTKPRRRKSEDVPREEPQ